MADTTINHASAESTGRALAAGRCTLGTFHCHRAQASRPPSWLTSLHSLSQQSSRHLLVSPPLNYWWRSENNRILIKCYYEETSNASYFFTFKYYVAWLVGAWYSIRSCVVRIFIGSSRGLPVTFYQYYLYSPSIYEFALLLCQLVLRAEEWDRKHSHLFIISVRRNFVWPINCSHIGI